MGVFGTVMDVTGLGGETHMGLFMTFFLSVVLLTTAAVGINLHNKCTKWHSGDDKERIHHEKVWMVAVLIVGLLGIVYVLVSLAIKMEMFGL